MSRRVDRPPLLRRRLTAARLLVGLVAGGVLTVAVPATAAAPIDGYAGYEPQKACQKTAQPGTTVLGKWLVKTYRGGFGPIVRPCTSSGVSEHKEGRAFDWTLDARKATDRARAAAYLKLAFATDKAGNKHSLARRQGVMYIIWNDRMYSSYNGFRSKAYLSSGCKSRAKCSTTLRHRDHMHISMSKAGGRGKTQWYAGRLS